MRSTALLLCSLLAAGLAFPGHLGAQNAHARTAIGDTLTVIQRPLPNIPALVAPGDMLHIYCAADPSAGGWEVELVRGGRQIPLPLSASSYDPATTWWTLTAVVPEVSLYELYDLVVTADDQPADLARRAVSILPRFKNDYYFVHITDPHLPTHLYYYQSGAEFDSSEVVDLREVIRDVSIINPEFVLLTGDLINEGELEDFLERRYYTRAQRLLSEFTVPVFLTSGNHDIGGWDSTPPPDGTARRNWWRFFGWPRLDAPPPGAPEYTQNYSFDYGPVHFVGLEAYDNYDMWRSNIYGEQSFTSGQLDWLEADLAAAAGSAAQVLFYHYDFSSQINLHALGVEMALWGHIHRDQGSVTTQPFNLATNCTCDGDRAYRLVRVVDGDLFPRETLLAGPGGEWLTVEYDPDNSGQHMAVTATVNNTQSQRFEHGRLRFNMPNQPGSLTVTGGTLQQIDDADSIAVYYVGVDIHANEVQTVSVELEPLGGTPQDSLGAAARLYQIHPNPFRGGTQLEFMIAATGHVEIVILDLTGREIATLLDEPRSAGLHRVSWDGSDQLGRRLPGGVYFARLAAGGHLQTRKILLAD